MQTHTYTKKCGIALSEINCYHYCLKKYKKNHEKQKCKISQHCRKVTKLLTNFEGSFNLH